MNSRIFGLPNLSHFIDFVKKQVTFELLIHDKYVKEINKSCFLLEIKYNDTYDFVNTTI